jgi:hypothetical protein
MRHRTVNMMYGNTQKQLRQIAVGEMSRLNGKAFTATLSISLRPEIRLGYPVYIKHIDTYYYVTGINHSFSFGSNAQTDLVLESRRERLYTEDGTKILKSHVYRLKENKIEGFSNTEVLTRQENFLKAKNVVGGFDTGFYEVSPANTKSTTSDATNVTATDSTELLTFTDKTVPFSDLNGYRHIGGFPYGANLKLDDSGELLTSSDLKDRLDLASELLKDPNQKVQDLEKRVIFNTTKYIRVGDDVIPQKVSQLKDEGLSKLKNYISDIKELRDRKINSDTLSALLKTQQKGKDPALYANVGVPKPPSTTQLTTPTDDQRDKIATGSVNIDQVS